MLGALIRDWEGVANVRVQGKSIRLISKSTFIHCSKGTTLLPSL